MEFRLQVFKNDPELVKSTRVYRFAVVDSASSKGYPANFVCMLPMKLMKTATKGKSGSAFGELFKEKSVDLAIELLNQALINESDGQIKTEIERRLKLIDPKRVNVARCYKCKKTYHRIRTRKYKKNFCDDCLRTKYTKQIVA